MINKINELMKTMSWKRGQVKWNMKWNLRRAELEPKYWHILDNILSINHPFGLSSKWVSSPDSTSTQDQLIGEYWIFFVLWSPVEKFTQVWFRYKYPGQPKVIRQKVISMKTYFLIAQKSKFQHKSLSLTKTRLLKINV